MGDVKPKNLILIFLLLLGCWRSPLAAQAQTAAYAVQVAAFQSLESAEELAHGLRARGLEAYCVKSELPGQGVWYRVRLGKFASISRARAYAEKLRKSGLLEQYLILAYDPPMAYAVPAVNQAPAAEPTNGSHPVIASLVPPVITSPAASISAPVSASTSASTSTPAPAASASPLGQAEREAILLVASRQWAMPSPLSAIARSRPAALPELAAASLLGLQLRPPPMIGAPPQFTEPPAPPPVIASAVSLPPPEVSPAVSPPAAPPTVAGEAPPAPVLEPEAPDLSPPRLRGVVETRNGQLQLVVHNQDPRRHFKGLARVSLGDAQSQSEAAPVPLALRPNEERSFPLVGAPAGGSNYTMTIFDEAGAVRLMRGASIGFNASASRAKAPEPEPPPQANDITIVPRQIAATSENITLEFEITSQRPLGYVSLVLRAGNLTDIKRAVLSSTQGRIPFLVPVRIADTVFSYELKDDQDQILVSGEDDLRRLARGGS
jgi:hypothetical protein